MKELKEILLEFKEKGIPRDLIKRKLDIKWMEKKANVLVGIRRSGKTYTLYQLMTEFDFKNVFYINMEDDRILNPNLEHLMKLIPTIKELFETGKKIFLFVDEIQNITGWEKWARRIAESLEVILFISGSSSKLSSFEIPTLLRGRTLTSYVFPLNLEEFLKFRGFNYEKNKMDYSSKKPEFFKLLNEYLSFGGFPEIILERDKSKKLILLKEYFSTIISKDINERHNIDNKVALETFMKYLLHNYSKYISFSKTQRWMNSIGIKVGKATLIEYYGYIKEAYFVNHTSIFSYKIKDKLQYPIKIYINDTGFIRALTIQQQNRGWICEQVVANELFKKAISEPSLELSYWRSNQQEEVDFVLKHSLKIKQLIQVCFDISDLETRERELKALLKASKELKCNNLLVITEDTEAEEKIKNKKVKFVPLWKWLLK